jgi:hypothetical protein
MALSNVVAPLLMRLRDGVGDPVLSSRISMTGLCNPRHHEDKRPDRDGAGFIMHGGVADFAQTRRRQPTGRAKILCGRFATMSGLGVCPGNIIGNAHQPTRRNRRGNHRIGAAKKAPSLHQRDC